MIQKSESCRYLGLLPGFDGAQLISWVGEVLDPLTFPTFYLPKR